MFSFDKIKIKKSQWIVILLVGALLMVISIPSSKTNDETKEEQQLVESVTQINNYEQEMKNKLEDILGKMDGVGNVSVMITFSDNGQAQVEKDETIQEDIQKNEEESTKNTSTTQETVYSSEEPFVATQIYPTIEGVLIVAEGGENTVVKQNISEAVEALFGLEAHKIKIVKMSL